MAAALQLLLVTLLARVAAASASAPLKLSSPRRMLTGVTVGEYSLFGGGFQGKEASRAVDVYRNGQFVRTDQLSQARGLAAATSVNELAFFAGGQTPNGTKSAVVDVFNSTSQSWSVAHLSVGRSMLAATAVGPFAMFGGGEVREHEGNTSKSDDVAVVDVFNYETGVWTTAKLCMPRKKLAATTVGNLAIFGGGYLSGGGGSRPEWDMFNASSGEWSHGNLSLGRMRLQAAAVGNRAFFVSGMGDTCGAQCPMVDVYDASTNSWSVTNLKRGRYEFAAVGFASKMLVTGGKQSPSSSTGGAWDLVEVFTPAQRAWTSTVVPTEARSYIAAVHHVIGSETVALVAGGDYQNGTTTNDIDVLRP